MRIAVVSTSYPAREGDPSGHFVQAEVRALEQEGHDVVVLTPDRARGDGAFGWPGFAARARARPWRALGAARWAFEARRALTRADVARVVCHWVVPSVLPIATSTRAPAEGVSHGGDVRLLLALPPAARAALVRRIAARLTSWRFVSESLLAALCDGLGAADAARVGALARVSPSPIEVPRPSAGARRAAHAHAPYVVAVARLVPAKRIDRAIDHAARAPSTRLVVVGDGPERSRLEARARARGLDARFVGLVSRDEALAWIGGADALLHASEAEGLSTVVREAETLGVPVVTLGTRGDIFRATR